MSQLKDYAGSRLGVFISGNDKQRHAGFIFDDEAGVEVLHLAWHFMLMRGTPEEYVNTPGLGPFSAYVCEDYLESQIDEILSFLDTIWSRNRNVIPYGISSDGIESFFETDGSVAGLGDGAGLTCASFLMSVFFKLGHKILDPDSWQHRESDPEWHNWVLSNLEGQTNLQPQVAAHAAAQRQYVGKAYRFRPEEVVGTAAVFEDEPASFQQAVSIGELVVQDMQVKGVLRSSRPAA
ncbi:hypothetical protein [Pseudomonas batumici]|uniref:hypothetical protein n=1 Tax=Pseudomonas batumici TaxID=226910 RepID=UPI0012EE06BA|nr:hypothetical protein [Pseudomonas batumici]